MKYVERSRTHAIAALLALVLASPAIAVKTVINLIGNEADIDRGEQAMVEQHGMRYVHIPMNTRKAPTDTEIAKFMSIVDDPNGGAVYVHCVGGRHRTGVMTAVYRMTKDGLT